MRSAVVVALVALLALAVGYYIGRDRAERAGVQLPTNGTYVTQDPDGSALNYWTMKDGRPVEVRQFRLFRDLADPEGKWSLGSHPTYVPRLDVSDFRPGDPPAAK